MSGADPDPNPDAAADWRRNGPTRSLFRRGLLTLAVLWLVWSLSPLTPSASAHTGDSSDSSNFRIVLVDPGSDCLSWKLLSADGYLELRSTCPGVVTVLGYEDEPYMEFSAEGVRENVNSPAAYLNQDALGEASVPESADAAAEPQWEPRSGLPTYRWHDHRVHWMVPEPPDVDADATRVREWTIPVRFDDDGTGAATYLIEARGELWYDRPLPSMVPITLVGGPMLVLTAFIVRGGMLAVGGRAGVGGGSGDRRLWRPVTRPLAAVVGLVTAATVVAVVVDHVLAASSSTGGKVLDAALVVAVSAVAGWGIRQGWRGDPGAVPVNVGAGLALAWVYGWRSRDFLGAAHLISDLPDLQVRLTVAAQLVVVLPCLAALGIWIWATRRPVPSAAALTGI
ncbi:MAG: hypothetical protein ACKV2O_09525 [Acidimicrobiales bacterium]